MYELNDTIAAVSSPSSDKRVIIRITGPRTTNTIKAVFRCIPPPTGGGANLAAAGVVAGVVAIDAELEVDAKLYLFLSPHSYTGEDVAELHIYTNPGVVEVFMEGLLGRGLRMAGPGEFTARSYMHGKIDLAQAEAVQEIIASSNRFQLAAAEQLLAGRLAETTKQVCAELMNCLGLIEAGIDFSGEDIEFMTRSEAAERLERIKVRLEQLLAGSIRCESVIDLPAVGIAGATNAGKSSLLNRLLGRERSIVSEQSRTTRDVLTGELSLAHCRVVIFDCAGLVPRTEGISNQATAGRSTPTSIEQGTPNSESPSRAKPEDILDELAQQAAVEALQKALVVVFCVDISKADWAEDVLIRRLIEPKVLIPVATKSDLLEEDLLAERADKLKGLFGVEFIVISSRTGQATAGRSAPTSEGVELLREAIDSKVIELTAGPAGLRMLGFAESAGPAASRFAEAGGGAALTARHRGAVSGAIEDVGEAVSEMQAGNNEVAAMMLRSAYERVSNIEQHIDEQILDNIFSRFCIGK